MLRFPEQDLTPNMAKVFIEQFAHLAEDALKILDTHRHADKQVMILAARYRSLVNTLETLGKNTRGD